jgi:SAM-dependent methyltransferase
MISAYFDALGSEWDALREEFFPEAVRARALESAGVECGCIAVDAAADYGFANMLLHHLETAMVAIREMARIVRPGGRMVVTDLEARDHEFQRVEHYDLWRGFPREDIRRWFHTAGLTSIRVESVGEECRAKSCDGTAAAVSIFLGMGMVLRYPQPMGQMT